MEEFFSGLAASAAEYLTTVGLRLLGALLLLWIGSKLIRWCVRLMHKSRRFAKMPPSVRALFQNLTKVALYVLLLVTVAAMLGVETTSIAAAIASAGLAIGLALQGSLSNFAGGVMLLLFHPFAIGDFIDDGTHTGNVTDIGIFYTTLVTPDNRTVTIPNGVLSNSSVTDYSANENRRLDLTLSVGYDSDIDRVKKILLETATSCDAVLSSPAPAVMLGEHGEHALLFYLRVWVRGDDYWNTRFYLTEETKKALDKDGVRIPFPQLDVHLER